MITDEWKTSLQKYLPLTLFVRVRKGYSRFACERELGTEQKLQYFDLHSYGRQTSFSFSRCSTGGPGVHSARCWLSLLHLIGNVLWSPNSIGVPEVPFGRVWLYLPHLIYLWLQIYCNCPSNSAVLTSVLTELYNSSAPTWSPTRSLKSNVYSSSSGNNCHAVHRSLSSDASVYECTMGIF